MGAFFKPAWLAVISLVFSGRLLGEESARAGQSSFQDVVNSFFGTVVDVVASFLFLTPFSAIGFGLPLILIVMLFGGIYFTGYLGFVNLRMFRHSIDVVKGKFDDPDDDGEITHFQALTSALSATVGLGNIAGVAVAIGAGGPGAIFWMWLVAFFGMSLKFASCTFGQAYRTVDADGHVIGGPFAYLKEGLKDLSPALAPLGTVLSLVFAWFTIFGSFGGGNLFQSNQTFELLSGQFPVLKDYGFGVGVVIAILAGVVIMGGIKRIGEVTGKLVPAMCAFYVTTCLIIIFANISEVPGLLSSIVTQAISPDAAFGGFMGVMIQGIKRASFSNEAGIGSAAIAHAAAKTKEPVREGTVAMIGPFIDTHLVCTMSALAILITGAHLDPTVAGKGALMTAKAFESVGSFMPMLLTFAAVIFAYSTIISWSYYGERATQFLFGRQAIKVYQGLYSAVVAMGPVLSMQNVVNFSDLMILSMAFPNIIGLVILSPKLKVMAKDYYSRLKAGQLQTYK